MLRDLEEVLLPAATHWQSPRFFAYFANTGSGAGDPRRAARGRAEPGRDPLAHLTGAAGARGADARLARAAARAAGRSARPPRGHGLDRDDDGPRGGTAREAGGSGRRLLRARALLGREGLPPARARARTVPVDDEFRLRLDALDLSGACAVVATVGTTSTSSVDPVRRGRCLRARGGLAARRPTPGSAAVCPEPPRRLRRLGARRLGRRQPAQVAAHADGLLRSWTRRSDPPRRLQPRAGVPA